MVKKLKVSSAITPMTFEEGYKEFIYNCKARALREATIKHYNEGYKSIVRFLDKDTLIKDINIKNVENFIVNYNSLELSTQTVHTYVRNLKTILYFFMRMDYTKQFKITLPKVDKSAIETYSDAELKILLKKPEMKKATFVEMRSWVVINFLLSTGIRSNSLINLKIKDIDFENEVVYVNVVKNRKPLIIPLNITIIKILKDYLKIRQHKSDEEYLFPTVHGEKFHRKTLNETLNQYNRARGCLTTGTHRYRHTFAKKFILSGGNPAILQKVLGHSNLQITTNYLNILVADIKKDMNRFNILEEFNSNNYIKMKK